MLAGQVLCMLGMASYTVLLPALQREWALSNAGSGLIGSGFFLGYICTVFISITNNFAANANELPLYKFL